MTMCQTFGEQNNVLDDFEFGQTTGSYASADWLYPFLHQEVKTFRRDLITFIWSKVLTACFHRDDAHPSRMFADQD